jgi:hypothetical protein
MWGKASFSYRKILEFLSAESLIKTCFAAVWFRLAATILEVAR